MMDSLMFQQQQQQLIVEENMSNLTSASGEASASSGTRTEIGNSSNYSQQQPYLAPPPSFQAQPQAKRKRNLPGNPDPDSEVIALSPKTLMATNRFICEICNKGFQRDQNLQLHRRGHNLPWKLKQRTNKDIIRKKVYVCPEPSCVHHDPSRALGDLTGIKKHFSRKHGEKKWKCDKCSKKYAVQSDWKAHSKTCGTREYRCDCGTLFSRRDSFITHRAFCDALAEESAREGIPNQHHSSLLQPSHHHINLQTRDQDNNIHATKNIFPLKKEQQSFSLISPQIMPPWLGPQNYNNNPLHLSSTSSIFSHDQQHHHQDLSNLHETPNPNPSSLGPTHLSPNMSATALLQKATQVGATMSKPCSSQSQPIMRPHMQPHVASSTNGNNNDNISNSGNNNFGLNLSSREDHVTTTTNAADVSHSSFLHHVMFEGTSFEDAFGGILNSNKDDAIIPKTNNGGNEAMTRDFLSLRPLSHTDFLTIAAIGNCMNSSTSHDQQNQSQKPWQG
ncbi:putative transcription factor C2H2 family [Lupinus albus]|uniref:Putative transcription factor C2H2 family n=1 Tax=Lupinus albus TaxID=3870 RepID=A0A6A4PFZ3_LUPAL|nr:putative transcription factor C2H2 family [Lupinus albus]